MWTEPGSQSTESNCKKTSSDRYSSCLNRHLKGAKILTKGNDHKGQASHDVQEG